MSEQYKEFKANDYVKTEADIRELIKAAMDEDLGDGTVIRAVLKHVARTHNMNALARDTGLNRVNLYDALSEDGNPTLTTLLKTYPLLGSEVKSQARRGPRKGRATDQTPESPSRVDFDIASQSTPSAAWAPPKRSQSV